MTSKAIPSRAIDVYLQGQPAPLDQPRSRTLVSIGSAVCFAARQVPAPPPHTQYVRDEQRVRDRTPTDDRCGQNR